METGLLGLSIVFHAYNWLWIKQGFSRCTMVITVHKGFMQFIKCVGTRLPGVNSFDLVMVHHYA